MLVGMDSSVTSTYRHLADKVYKNPGTNVFGLFLSPLYIIRWKLPIYNKVEMPIYNKVEIDWFRRMTVCTIIYIY